MGMCGGGGPEAKGRDPRGTPDGRRGGEEGDGGGQSWKIGGGEGGRRRRRLKKEINKRRHNTLYYLNSTPIGKHFSTFPSTILS